MTLLNDPNLVVWFPFTEGAGSTSYDYSSEVNNGTNTAITYSKNKTGKYNAGFNGSSSNIDIANDSSINFIYTSSFSIFAWVNTSSLSVAQRIYGQVPNFCGMNYLTFGFGTNGKIDANEYRDCGRGGTGTIYSTSALVINTWAHVGITYNGTTLTVYFNGVAENSANYAGLATSAANVSGVWGKDKRFGAAYFTGKMADCRIYDKSLSANEVKDLYKKTYIQ